VYNIRTRYNFGILELMYLSPRFGVMLLAMTLSIIFTIIDICSVTEAFKSALPVGINPFWKLAFVFKLLTDSVILDDFKTALDKLCAINLSRVEEHSGDGWPSHNVSASARPGSSHKPTTSTQGARRKVHGSNSGDAWIEVTTETKVESYKMAELGQHRSREAGQKGI
jgi:hypothetical protein